MDRATKPAGLLIAPYGGTLIDLLVKGEERDDFIQRANRLPSVQLSPRSVCYLELLATGAFSPLDRFMGRADYTRTVEEMRLANGMPFPIPVTLPMTLPDGARAGHGIALRSPRNELLAVMRVDEVFERDEAGEAIQVFGTTDCRHPLVAEMTSWPKHYVSGPIKVVNLPKHHDFPELRRTPAQVRELLQGLGYANVVAFQTRNPIHRGHEELTKQAASRGKGGC